MSDYLEFPIEAEFTDENEETATVFVHTKDNRLIVLRDVRGNPIIYKGILHIDNAYYDDLRVTSQFRVEDFSHLSYYIKSKDNKNG